MSLNKQEFKIDFAGKTISLTASRIAEQANSALIGQCGDTIVLATVTISKENSSKDYLPLVVDYEEKFYAAGKIIGSRFVRREGRPSEEAILSGRLIDRSIRPLFDSRIRKDMQIVITVLSYDEENDPDFISLLTASTALAASEIPWAGPIAGIKLTRLANGETVINPVNSQIREWKEKKEIEFEAFIAGPENKISMIELAGNESEEEKIVGSFELGQKEMKKLIEFQKEVVQKIGKQKLDIKFDEEPRNTIKKESENFLEGKLENALYAEDKILRQEKLSDLKRSLSEHLEQKMGKENFSQSLVDAIFEEAIDDLVHKKAVEEEKRPDGRKIDEIRPLFAEVGFFKRLHGSALFMRGSTQALAAVTLAAPGAEQLIETMEISAKRRFMLHYNFPPYSTGEIRRLGTPGRREVGHGALAEKAVKPFIPSQEEFPYTIRIVSEILSSNGSSSMATVCASSLALMDAGVPVKKAVAGIAMGLMKSKEGNYKILTDIQGPEDHYGDMDCKVAGTKDGVSAVQMDVKIEGIDSRILKEILVRARKARLEILETMNKAIDKPKERISSYAPIIMTLEINPEQIGEVIGPGGKVINKIIKDTGVETIDIEESGRVFVASSDHEKAISAVRYIKSMTRAFQIGEIIEGAVIKILDFGAIVDLGGGRDGMIHISELKDGFVQKVEDVVKIGDIVKAKIVKIENGRVGLSLKAVKESDRKQ